MKTEYFQTKTWLQAFSYNSKMRILLLLLFAMLTSLDVEAGDGYFQLNGNETELKFETLTVGQIIDKIESSTEYRFVYKIKDINLKRRVVIDINNKPIEVILKKLFDDTKVSFSVLKNQIYLSRKDNKPVEKAKVINVIEQQQKVSGVVIDENENPLPGVTIKEKDKANGTTTGFDGDFTLSVDEGAILEFSYVGYKKKELSATDNMRVQMEVDLAGLSEVVVTAFGVTRDKKALGYTVETVKGDEVNEVKTSNFMNSLSGKIAGIDIKPSGTMGGSTNVIIRGYSSLLGNNQALFVVDGTPINNDNNNASGQATGGGGYDYGNAAMDINPDDIESLSVLKGAAATALYGSRGSNGVIFITTKKGNKSSKMRVGINSSTMFGNVDKTTLPTYQSEYGSGYGPYYGVNKYFVGADFDDSKEDKFQSDGDPKTYNVVTPPTAQNGSFGAKFDPNLELHQWDSFYPDLPSYGKKRPWVVAQNSPYSFFETATTLINGVNLQGGDEKGTYRLSYTNFDQQGVMPNSNLVKNTVSLSASRNFTDKLSASTFITYVKQNTKGRQATGYEAKSAMMNFRQWWQVNTDISMLKDAYFRTGKNINANPKAADDTTPFYFNNPYYERYNNFTTDYRTRYFGNVSLMYKIVDWLNVQGNVSFDTYSEGNQERYSKGSRGVPYYRRYNGDVSEYNYRLTINANKDISEDFSLDGTLGYNLRTNYWNKIRMQTNGGLGVDNLYALSNTISYLESPSLEYLSTQKVEAFFGRVSLGYKDFLYTDITYRVDRSSALPIENNLYGYPSISGSFIFSNLIKGASWLSFGKLRVNYAQVGNSPQPYRTNSNYVLRTPFNGVVQAVANTTLNNSELKAERTNSVELGAEIRMLENRVSLDVSYYDKTTSDLLTPVNVSTATGVSSKFLNAGSMRNRGVELVFSVTPVKLESFSWDIIANWSLNRNTVLELANGLDNLQIGQRLSGRSGVTINATPGLPYGSIRGSNFVYHENGGRIVGDDGAYLKSSESNQVIGNIQADWRGGLRNNFRYKNLSLGFLIDIKQGGQLFSADTFYGYANGLYPNTVGNNELGNPIRNLVSDGGGITLDGVDENGNPNTKRGTMADNSNVLGYNTAPEALHIYDASFVKLREMSISYNFPKKLLEKTPLTTAKISIIGRNLWIIHKNLPYADPEVGFSSGNVQGFQLGASPLIREMGVNINLNF